MTPRGRPYRPACYGFHHHGSAAIPCHKCPFADGCMAFRVEVTERIVKVSGTDNPRLAHKRKLAAARQRRHRAKKAGGL